MTYRFASLVTLSSLLLGTPVFAARAEQERIVAALTGFAPLPSGTVLVDRNSTENRRQTRDYLAGILSDLELTAKR